MSQDPPQNNSDSEDGYTFQYRASGDNQPLVAIVKAVSSFKGVGVTDLEPLNNVVNIEPVNELFGEGSGEFYRNSSDSRPIDLRFQYEGCLVTVTDDEIQIERAPEPDD